MPGLITHYIHGEAVINELPAEVKKIVKANREIYNAGTQGPDVFFYFLPALLNKKISGIGTKMHKGDFSLFLKNMAEGIAKIQDNREQEALKSYVYGYLTHYMLDVKTHPYIYFKTGSRREGEIKTLKYSVYHRNFETALDCLILKLATGEKPSDKKLNKMIKFSGEKKDTLAEVLSESIHKSYAVPISSRQVRRAFGYMSGITWLLESKKGRRKRLTEFVEGITVKDKIVSSLMHYGAVQEGIDYLNSQKSNWSLPWNIEEKYDHSFTEMFQEAIDEAKNLIVLANGYFDGTVSIDELLLSAKSLSFATGLDFKNEVEFKYSDIVYA